MTEYRAGGLHVHIVDERDSVQKYIHAQDYIKIDLSKNYEHFASVIWNDEAQKLYVYGYNNELLVEFNARQLGHEKGYGK